MFCNLLHKVLVNSVRYVQVEVVTLPTSGLCYVKVTHVFHCVCVFLCLFCILCAILFCSLHITCVGKPLYLASIVMSFNSCSLCLLGLGVDSFY